MNSPTPPWCLHWGRDGELVKDDRQDLLQTLALKENGLTRLMLSQAMHLEDNQPSLSIYF